MPGEKQWTDEEILQLMLKKEPMSPDMPRINFEKEVVGNEPNPYGYKFYDVPGSKGDSLTGNPVTPIATPAAETPVDAFAKVMEEIRSGAPEPTPTISNSKILNQAMQMMNLQEVAEYNRLMKENPEMDAVDAALQILGKKDQDVMNLPPIQLD